MSYIKKYKYQVLTEYLLKQLPSRYAKNFYSWIEKGKLINEGKVVSRGINTHIQLAFIEYDAILFFNELPFTEIDPTKIMALIQIWLNENDEERDVLDDYEIEFDLDIISETTADLTFSINFKEPITAKEDESGDLVIDGKNYQLDEVEIHTVEECEVQINEIREQIHQRSF